MKLWLSIAISNADDMNEEANAGVNANVHGARVPTARVPRFQGLSLS